MTRRIYAPRLYQQPATEHLLTHPRCALWAGMGLGKTVSTLTALDALFLSETAPALILGPLRVARRVWTDEAAKWEHLRGLEVSPIVGGLPARIAALKRDANVFTVNYEILPWLVDYLGERWPFGTVVADESTRLKGFRLRQGTLRARAIARLAHTKIKRWINLTGTPSPNGLKDLWGQTWFLDAGERLGRTFSAFQQRWFQVSFDGFSIEPLPLAREQIEGKLADLCLSIQAEDHFDLAKPIINNVYVDLPTSARRLYRDMEKEMFLELEGHEVEAFNAAARTQKLLQLANGAVYVDPLVSSEDVSSARMWKEVHDVKLQALEEIIEEAAGAPVLVAYQFRSDLTRLLKAFPKARLLSSDESIRAFALGTISVGLAHPKSMGHGVEGLQEHCNILAFFGHDWNLEEYLQMIERIGPVRQMQSGHKRPVFVHHIIARDTVDELVMARREGKRSVQDLLLAAMKRRSSHA